MYIQKGEQKMADKVLDNNQVTIVGVVDSEFVYSHEVFGEGFYVDSSVPIISMRKEETVWCFPYLSGKLKFWRGNRKM